MSKIIHARGYTAGPLPFTLASIVADLVGEAGESLAPGVEAALSTVEFNVTYWLRCAGTAASTLTRLCRRFGLVWRVLDDGTIFVGKATYAADTTKVFVADPGDDGSKRVVTTAPNAATLRPDTTVLGRKVIRVVYTLNTEGLRAELYYPSVGGFTDSEDMERMVRTWLPELPYASEYAATITNVRSGGRVEVRADDESIGEMDGAKVLVGAPEMAVTPTNGQRMRLAFSSSRPDLPYVLGFEQDPDATKGVARESDPVDCGWYTITAPPGGGPCTIVEGGGAGVPGAFHVTGSISKGHPNVKLTNAGQ